MVKSEKKKEEVSSFLSLYVEILSGGLFFLVDTIFVRLPCLSVTKCE